MEVIAFSPEAEAVLRRCRDALVVLDFVRLLPDASEGRGELMHRRAAKAAVVEAQRRLADEVEANIAEAPDLRDELLNAASRIRADAERVERIDPLTLGGQRISLAEFFGSGYKDGRLVPDVEDHYSSSSDLDFTRAFCVPPYGLRGPAPDFERLARSDLVALFEATVEDVLRTSEGSREIWSWATDWSDYFEHGREWWGAACWTIDAADGAIVAVLASTTD